MSLLMGFRVPRRRQILLPSKGRRSPAAEGLMSPVAPGTWKPLVDLFLQYLYALFLCLLALFFQVVVFLSLEPLPVDCGLPSRPSHPQTPRFRFGGSSISGKIRIGDLKMLFWMFGGSVGLVLDALGGSFRFFEQVYVAPRISKTYYLGPLGPRLGPLGPPRGQTQHKTLL